MLIDLVVNGVLVYFLMIVLIFYVVGGLIRMIDVCGKDVELLLVLV